MSPLVTTPLPQITSLTYIFTLEFSACPGPFPLLPLPLTLLPSASLPKSDSTHASNRKPYTFCCPKSPPPPPRSQPLKGRIWPQLGHMVPTIGAQSAHNVPTTASQPAHNRVKSPGIPSLYHHTHLYILFSHRFHSVHKHSPSIARYRSANAWIYLFIQILM